MDRQETTDRRKTANRCNCNYLAKWAYHRGLLSPRTGHHAHPCSALVEIRAPRVPAAVVQRLRRAEDRPGPCRPLTFLALRYACVVAAGALLPALRPCRPARAHGRIWPWWGCCCRPATSASPTWRWRTASRPAADHLAATHPGRPAGSGHRPRARRCAALGRADAGRARRRPGDRGQGLGGPAIGGGTGLRGGGAAVHHRRHAV